MNAKELRSKSVAELADELLKLRKEQFSLRMQRATGQTVKPTDFGRVRKDVARLKTVMREQQIAAQGAGTAAAGAKGTKGK
jgi:large subunit ribosomal protein L29